jgi:hypothetical protein
LPAALARRIPIVWVIEFDATREWVWRILGRGGEVARFIDLVDLLVAAEQREDRSEREEDTEFVSHRTRECPVALVFFAL